MISRLMHIGVTVMDWDRMLRFYQEVIGLDAEEPVDHPLGGRKVILRGSDAEVLEMIQYLDTPLHTGRDRFRTGLHHFGLLVDDVRAEYDRMIGLGVDFDGEVKVNTAGDLVVHFWDPEGNRVHLTQVCE